MAARSHACRRAAATAMVIVAGAAAGSGHAQVRSIVLETPARPVALTPPPLYPPRRATLEALWEVPSQGTVLDGLLGGPSGVIYAVREGTVRDLSPGDGRTLWETVMPGGIEFAPIGRDGRVYLISDRTAVGLSPTSGTIEWTRPLPLLPAFPPAAAASLLAVPLPGGTMLALDAETGALLWERQTGCEFSSPPGSGGGAVVIGCEDGHLLALDEADGSVRWDRQTGARIRMRPVVDNGRVYLGNDAGQVLALGLRKGRRRYTARTAAAPVAPGTVHRKLLILGAMDNLLYGFRSRRGHLAWTADIGVRVLSAPALRGDLAASAPPLSPEVVIMDTRDGAVLARARFDGEERLSAAGPVFAGPALISASRSVAGGSGWLAAHLVHVEVLPEDASAAAARPF